MALRLALDLGDILTKGLLLGAGAPRRFGFPSAVAGRLVDPGTGPHPFPEAARLAPARAVPGARYAGWLAAAWGADRRLLGAHPEADTIDALVRKAIMKAGVRAGELELALLVDVGVKGAALARYAEAMPRPAEFLRWTVNATDPEPVKLSLRARLLDAPLCAAAALPPELAIERIGRILLVDIGYLRTKLAVLSADGCERQEQVDAAVSGCVARVLRDGRELGLVDDELAVVRALERGRDHLEVAGRRFDLSASLGDARRALAADLGRAIARVAIEQVQRRGEGCRAVAIVGGGAALVGPLLAERLAGAELGLRTIWLSRDTRFHHLAGAQRLLGHG
jgi:hypothetical protein